MTLRPKRNMKHSADERHRIHNNNQSSERFPHSELHGEDFSAAPISQR